MKNEDKAKEISNNNCTHICLADCSAESYFSSEIDCYKTAMEMAEWKDRQLNESCENCLKLHEKFGKRCAFLDFDNKHCWEI